MSGRTEEPRVISSNQNLKFRFLEKLKIFFFQKCKYDFRWSQIFQSKYVKRIPFFFFVSLVVVELTYSTQLCVFLYNVYGRRYNGVVVRTTHNKSVQHPLFFTIFFLIPSQIISVSLRKHTKQSTFIFCLHIIQSYINVARRRYAPKNKKYNLKIKTNLFSPQD